MTVDTCRYRDRSNLFECLAGYAGPIAVLL